MQVQQPRVPAVLPQLFGRVPLLGKLVCSHKQALRHSCALLGRGRGRGRGTADRLQPLRLLISSSLVTMQPLPHPSSFQQKVQALQPCCFRQACSTEGRQAWPGCMNGGHLAPTEAGVASLQVDKCMGCGGKEPLTSQHSRAVVTAGGLLGPPALQEALSLLLSCCSIAAPRCLFSLRRQLAARQTLLLAVLAATLSHVFATHRSNSSS